MNQVEKEKIDENKEIEPAVKNGIGAVMVVGGGIAGIQSALDLADSGYLVYLVEKQSAIGGTMPQLDKTFPTNDCSMCILSPKLVECGRHLNIRILTNTQIVGLEGEAGNFSVSLVQSPRYIDAEKCVGCGICAQKCPKKVPDEFNEGLGIRKAAYISYPQAVPSTYQIDRKNCLYFIKGRCRICEKFCENKAVDFEQKEKSFRVNVGSIILSPGFDTFKVDDSSLSQCGYTSLISQYGYSKFPNVLTSLEFERILSASGPYGGDLMRPSDEKHPEKIAWIQCVGSRDVTCDSGYCSSVCCMYAIKEAVIAKEHSEKSLDISIFYMDIRTYGKEFEKYYERAKQEHKINFIKSKVYGITQLDETGNLYVKFADIKGEIKEEEFDLVILSVGLKPGSSAVSLAERLGINLNKYNFCETSSFKPINTSKPGIYVCGTFQGPKDIPETVMEASGAAACSSALLSNARGSLVKEKTYPKERDVTGEPPRIGFFICHCGINIGGVLDVKSLRDYVKTLPNVVFAEDNLYTCSQDSQEKIKEKILEHNINRVVVSSCSPRTHEPLFQETIREAGLNPYLFEMANIRDQCSWVHMDEPELATKKAKDLIDMAISKVRLLRPLKMVSLTTTPSGLVIGGGIAGMVSALNLAEQGFEVHLIEKGMNLGGLSRKVYTSLDGEDVQKYLKELTAKVTDHPLINVYTRAKIKESEGYIGNFVTKITLGSKKDVIEIKHGIVIIATGAEEYKPTDEYLYKKSRNVITLLELEGEIAKKSKRITGVKNIVMINCVGSRDEERPYCSRICCSQSIKCALKIKELNPDINIYILYRDIRTYGFNEDYYREARERGIIFINYEPERKPIITSEKDQGREVLMVKVNDPVLGQDFIIDADIVSLAAATIPLKTNKDLSQMFKVPLNEDGFFLEAHMKLRPVDFATDGVFVCGLAHNPKSISETIIQANAAASRASIVLSKEVVELEGTVSRVNKDKCSGCGLCEAVCAFKAINIDPENNVAVVNEALCKGCGACVASCRPGAIDLQGFSNKQILAMLDTI